MAHSRIALFLSNAVAVAASLTLFFTGIAPAPMNVWMGILIVSYLLKRIICKQPIFPRLGIGWPLFLFFALVCVSMLYSVDPRDTFKGGVLRWGQYILLMYAVAAEVRTTKQLWWVLTGAFAGAGIASLDGIWQVHSLRDFIRGYAPVVNLGVVRATGPFKDSNLLGIYLSAIAPLAIGMAAYYARGRARIVLAVVSLLVVAGIVLTYSRPTILALYIALILFALVRRQKVMLGLLAVALCAAPFAAPAAVKQWAKSVDYHPVRFMCNDDRIAIYRNSMQMIKANAFLGVGANTFMKNYLRYKEHPEYRGVVTSDYCYAHNNILHMAGELGFAGIALFAWFLYALGRKLYKGFSREKDLARSVALCSVGIGLVSFLINGLTESSLYYARVAVLFWVMAGVGLALAHEDPVHA